MSAEERVANLRTQLMAAMTMSVSPREAVDNMLSAIMDNDDFVLVEVRSGETPSVPYIPEVIVDEPLPAPSMWMPEPDVIIHEAVGKLGEECNECGKIAFRVLIQGIDEHDPKTHELNRDALFDEMADVVALVEVCRKVLHPDAVAFGTRVHKKIQHKLAWLRGLGWTGDYHGRD